MIEKQPCLYILASHRNGTLYVGVTSDLIKRIYEHRNNAVEGFTNKYGVHDLVWYGIHMDMIHAILRDKQLKKRPRAAKIRLLEKHNPAWRDLWQELISRSLATGFRQSMPE
jgi:putative endonuclease